MKVGDTVKCSSPEDLIDTMYELEKSGYTTDFMYEKNGIRGYWLEIKGVSNE